MNVKLIKLSIVGIAFGLALAVGLYTFIYAKGYSYMSNNPGNCANCHIMNEQFDGWQKSSHKNVATCNDCHVPHDFIGKYATKASNGFWHSYYFTTNTFHEPIQLTKRSREITEESCRYCHQNMVESITVSMDKKHTDEVSCLRCHNSVGHLH
jgi:cytochrome c nitrite reductase small subunit